MPQREQEQQSTDSPKTGRGPNGTGMRAPLVPVTEEMREKIHAMTREFGQKDVARDLGMSKATLMRIVNGQTKQIGHSAASRVA